MDILQTLNKTNEDIEHFVYLFEECNLRCSFCWQDHDSKVGQDSIANRADDLINDIKQNPHQPHSINIMGGELFHDDISDQLFNDYKMLIIAIQEFANQEKVTVSFTFVTNLIYQRVTRVIDLIQHLRTVATVSLTTSYDPVGRFNNTNRDLFFNNLKLLQRIDSTLITNISVVMTRPNINYLMSNDDHQLDWIYDNFSLYFDYYSPNQTAPFHTPTESEMLSFFRWVIKTYPNAGPIVTWKGNQVNQTSCRRSQITGPNGNQGRCCSLLDEFPQRDKNLIPVFNISDNRDMERWYMDQKGCLHCEFFKRCTMGCFLIHTHSLCNDMKDQCIYKIIFNEHPEWPK